MELTRKQRNAISKIIDDLYFRVKARLFGQKFRGPRIYFEIVKETNPLETLEGMFRYAYLMQRGTEYGIEEKQINQHVRATNNYLDAHRLKLQNEIFNGIMQSENFSEVKDLIQDKMESTKEYLDLLIGSEVREAQATAESEGIAQAAGALGIDDPVVVKLGVIDDRLSKQCRKLWHESSNIYKPVPYKLSELADGYNTDMKNPVPTKGKTHPNCRHVLAFVPPNFGFDAKGNIQFISFGYNYYSDAKRQTD